MAARYKQIPPPPSRGQASGFALVRDDSFFQTRDFEQALSGRRQCYARTGSVSRSFQRCSPHLSPMPLRRQSRWMRPSSAKHQWPRPWARRIRHPRSQSAHPDRAGFARAGRQPRAEGAPRGPGQARPAVGSRYRAQCAALFTVNASGTHPLRGGLSYCAVPTDADYYSRFSDVYSSIRTYFAP